MRGRWAAGIVPRNFCWIVKDHLAVSERPGGYAPNHRKVRRQEELLWLRAQGFTRVVSLLGSTHNLHAYEELGLEWSRFPLPAASETPLVLAALYPAMRAWLRNGERLLLHQEELGDCVMGVVAGYLLWSEILPDGPRAITAMEQLLRRQMGTVGRMIVAAVDEVPSPRTLGDKEPVEVHEVSGELSPRELEPDESPLGGDSGVLEEALTESELPAWEAPSPLNSEQVGASCEVGDGEETTDASGDLLAVPRDELEPDVAPMLADEDTESAKSDQAEPVSAAEAVAGAEQAAPAQLEPEPAGEVGEPEPAPVDEGEGLAAGRS